MSLNELSLAVSLIFLDCAAAETATPMATACLCQDLGMLPSVMETGQPTVVASGPEQA